MGRGGLFEKNTRLRERPKMCIRDRKMREALSVAKEEQDEASSRPVSRRSSARRTKRKVRFLDSR